MIELLVAVLIAGVLTVAIATVLELYLAAANAPWAHESDEDGFVEDDPPEGNDD